MTKYLKMCNTLYIYTYIKYKKYQKKWKTGKKFLLNKNIFSAFLYQKNKVMHV